MLVPDDVIVLDSPKIGGPVSGGQTTQNRLAFRSALGTFAKIVRCDNLQHPVEVTHSQMAWVYTARN